MTAKQRREIEASALSKQLDRRIEQIERACEPICCEVTGKLLARKDAHAIYLWCKACKAEHLIPLD